MNYNVLIKDLTAFELDFIDQILCDSRAKFLLKQLETISDPDVEPLQLMYYDQRLEMIEKIFSNMRISEINKSEPVIPF